MFASLSPTKLLLLLAILVLLFGAKRLPALAESLGKAKKKFQDASADKEDSADSKEPKT
jgi:sec-independent protein translocase protein TatA